MAALVAAIVVALGAILGFLRVARGAGPTRYAVVAAMACAAVPVAHGARRAVDRVPVPSPVRTPATTEYVSSSACKSCHPSEYASWHDSYHRTMTQTATASTVLAPLETTVSLILDGRAYAVRRRGDGVWATWPGGAERRIVMTTGSHHYQAFWAEGDELTVFPFVYLLADRRWIPRREAFVQPPGEDAPVAWATNCIACHATAGSPGREGPSKPGRGPEAAELGIACEACHGPGGRHVAMHADPFERWVAHTNDRADPTIVNPSRLDASRASMICGSCHAYTYPRDEEDFLAHGYTQSFRPGADLDAAKFVLTAERLGTPGFPRVDTAVENLFYDDGTVRIGGREYNGLVLSACFTRADGKRRLGCLSCHSMHDSDPDDQLARGREHDGACFPCHDAIRYATPAHTHHREGSAGSACMGCHMPKTAYALLKSIRSHRIDSPRASALTATDRPNACNLCHLDRSLAWTSAALVAWYGQGGDDGANADPAGARWLLAGDPGQRAVAAAAFEDPGARAAARDPAFARALLRAAENDPYPAVRTIAARSLRATGGSDGSARELPPGAVDALVAARSTRALTLSE